MPLTDINIITPNTNIFVGEKNTGPDTVQQKSGTVELTAVNQ